MLVSVVIPVYNEINTIHEIIEAVDQVDLDKEIIIVDDFSTDGTRDVYEKLKSKYGSVQVFLHEKNMGKGAALRTGFANARGEYVVVQDADLEYDPQEIKLLLQPLLDDKADVVYGSRFQSGRPHRVMYFWHMLGNKMLTLMSNMFTNLNLTDMETCYKMIRRSMMEGLEIEENRFGFEPEITAKLKKRNLRFFEIGISYSGRTYEEGKKIGLRDAFRAVWCIFKYNLRFWKY